MIYQEIFTQMNAIVRSIFAMLLALFLGVSFTLHAEEEADSVTDEKGVVQEETGTDEPLVEKSECEGDACESEESEGEEGYDSEEIDEDSLAKEVEVEKEEPPALESLTVKHQIGDEELPAKTVTADLMVLLQTLKEDIIAQTEKQTKPFTIKTEVTGVWAEKFADSWGKLPPLAITTEIDKEGKGKSAITLPAFNKVLPDPSGEDEEATVDWKGLQGQLTFAEKLADLKVDLTMQGFTITGKAEEGKQAPTFNMEKTTVKGEFDADLVPIALAGSLPSLKLIDEDIQMVMQNVTFEGKVKPFEQGIELSTGEFKMQHLQLTDGDGVVSTFKDFEIKSDGGVEKEGVVYKINTKIGNVTMPKKALNNLIDIDLSYVGDLELRRLDTESVKQLQQTARNLQKQQHSGEIPADMVGITWFAKLNELAPALLAKSPELALSQLKLTAADGKLDGKIVMSIDGKKGSSLEDFSSLMNALQVQADFNMTKVLLEKTMTAVMTNLQVEKGSPEKDASKEAQTFTEKQIKGYIEQKFLKEAGDNYELSATFKEGKFTVNGQEMPLPF